jgi:hypothetical protein
MSNNFEPLELFGDVAVEDARVSTKCHGQVFSDKQIRKKAGQWVFGKVVVPSCSNSLGET